MLIRNYINMNKRKRIWKSKYLNLKGNTFINEERNQIRDPFLLINFRENKRKLSHYVYF